MNFKNNSPPMSTVVAGGSTDIMKNDENYQNSKNSSLFAIDGDADYFSSDNDSIKLPDIHVD